jgi:hypothetical protein
VTAGPDPRVPQVRVPWRVGDLTLLSVLSFLGLAGLMTGWIGASSSTTVRTEELWLVVGIVAAVLSGFGNAMWLLAGHRTVRGRAKAVTAEIRELLLVPTAGDATVVNSEPVVGGALVAAARMTHFHRRTCHLTVGKKVIARTHAQHLKSGRHACGVCQPLEPAR